MPTHGHSDPAPVEPPEVVVAGAGPSGLMLACELALAGIHTVVLERRTAPVEHPTADELLGPAVRIVDHRGLHERLADPHRPLVAVLAERATELGVEIRRGHELAGLTQDDAAVTVEVAGPEGSYRVRTDYLVGADGARSATREHAGIGFPAPPHPNGAARIADRLRDRRVFLIGDAAHAYDPTAGGPHQGLDLGLTDAFNLGWKLAAAVLGDAGPSLLDSFERERRPAAERAAANAPVPTGIDVPYEVGGHDSDELAGRLAPETTLQTPGGSVRLAELTTRALPLLVDRTDGGTLASAIAPWHDEVDILRAQPHTDPACFTALFLRPDCLVAWSSKAVEPTPAEREALRAASERWLGPRPS